MVRVDVQGLDLGSVPDETNRLGGADASPPQSGHVRELQPEHQRGVLRQLGLVGEEEAELLAAASDDAVLSVFLAAAQSVRHRGLATVGVPEEDQGARVDDRPFGVVGDGQEHVQPAAEGPVVGFADEGDQPGRFDLGVLVLPLVEPQTLDRDKDGGQGQPAADWAPVDTCEELRD